MPPWFTMAKTGEELTTRTMRYQLDDQGFVWAAALPGSTHDLDDARENVRTAIEISGGAKVPHLIDMRLIRNQTREARAYYAGPETAEAISAVALLIGSPLSRAIANFFLGLNKPMMPTRLFTSEEEAIDWLLQHA